MYAATSAVQRIDHEIDLTAIVDSAIAIGSAGRTVIRTSPELADRNAVRNTWTRTNVAATAAVVPIVHQIDTNSPAKAERWIFALAFPTVTLLFGQAGVPACAAVLGIAREVRLATVAAQVVVAIGLPPNATEVARRAIAEGTEIDRKDAFPADPRVRAHVRGSALPPARAAVLWITIELRASVFALRKAGRTTTRAVPADFSLLAGITARTAVRPIEQECLAAVLELPIAVAEDGGHCR